MLWSFVLGAIAVGCGAETADDPRVPISGTITLDSKLIEGGDLIFEPLARLRTTGGEVVEF